jgi:hypothetical protein
MAIPEYNMRLDDLLFKDLELTCVSIKTSEATARKNSLIFTYGKPQSVIVAAASLVFIAGGI